MKYRTTTALFIQTIPVYLSQLEWPAHSNNNTPWHYSNEMTKSRESWWITLIVALARGRPRTIEMTPSSSSLAINDWALSKSKEDRGEGLLWMSIIRILNCRMKEEGGQRVLIVTLKWKGELCCWSILNQRKGWRVQGDRAPG